MRDGTRWGPRTIDLDLLVYGDESDRRAGAHACRTRSSHERLFVLEPLAELAPDLVVPGLGQVSELVDESYNPPP